MASPAWQGSPYPIGPYRSGLPGLPLFITEISSQYYSYNDFELFFFFFFGHTAQLMGILALRPGIKPVRPAVEGRVLTTGPPGKSLSSSSVQDDVLRASWRLRHFTWTNNNNHSTCYDYSTVQMRILGHREVNEYFQGHTARKWQSWDSVPCFERATILCNEASINAQHFYPRPMLSFLGHTTLHLQEYF